MERSRGGYLLLGYGVMVTQQILGPVFLVRVRVAQQKKGVLFSNPGHHFFYFLF